MGKRLFFCSIVAIQEVMLEYGHGMYLLKKQTWQPQPLHIYVCIYVHKQCHKSTWVLSMVTTGIYSNPHLVQCYSLASESLNRVTIFRDYLTCGLCFFNMKVQIFLFMLICFPRWLVEPIYILAAPENLPCFRYSPKCDIDLLFFPI